MLSIDLIHEAAEFLSGQVRETPVEHSPVLSDRLGVPVWFKLENLQVTGSFKARGALFSLSRIKANGIQHVATCSAGNHGKGVAWAATQLDMQASIFVPKGVDPVKYDAMKRMGVDVRRSDFIGYDDTERWAIAEAERLGLPFVSAYDDDDVMAANGGSVAMEIEHQVPDANTFVMPVGGGGHAGGFAFYMKHRNPESRIIVCQHEDSPGFLRSVEANEPVTELPGIKTLASGLEGGFGRKTWEVLKNRFDAIRLLSEEELKEAMRWMVDEHQIIMEGSSAASVAACLDPEFPIPDGPVVIFISGRNIARTSLIDVLSENG